MLAPMILVAAMAVPSGVADGPQGPGTQLVLEVSAKPIHPDGRQTGRASSNDPSSFTNEFVYAGETPCTLGASASERTITTPGNGWRVSGRVLRHEDGGLFVQLDWQRQWYQSQKIADGLGGSQQVSIKTGDTLALDEIYVTPNAACDAVGVRLEASVVERPVPPPTARMRGGVGMSSGAVAGATGAGAAGAGTATGEQGRLVNPAGNVASAGRAGVGARGGGRRGTRRGRRRDGRRRSRRDGRRGGRRDGRRDGRRNGRSGRQRVQWETGIRPRHRLARPTRRGRAVPRPHEGRRVRRNPQAEDASLAS